MVPARIWPAITRSGSAEKWPDVTASNTFGWTHAVSINRVVLNSQKLLSLCFVGTRMRSNITYISRMFLDLPFTLIASLTNLLGSHPPEKQMVYSGLDPSRASCSSIC